MKSYLCYLTLAGLLLLPVALPQAEQQGRQDQKQAPAKKELRDSGFYKDDLINERRARFGQAEREFVAVQSPQTPTNQGSVSFASPGGGTYSRSSIEDSARHEYSFQDLEQDSARARPDPANRQFAAERPVRQLSPAESIEQADQRHERGPGPVDELRERGAIDFEHYERAEE